MARITHLIPRPYFRAETRKKALTITVALAFLGSLAGPCCLSGQAQGQFQGAFGSPQQQLPDQSRFPNRSPEPDGFPKHSQKRKQAMLDYNYKKLKQHAQDLAELAKSLQVEIEKSNENVLSLEIVKKAEQAEKLAKKIKNEAKGF